MKNKKGFTLVELLAVITILAIILLIAVPQILGVIENAKRDSFKNSTLSVFKAVELKAVTQGIKSGEFKDLALSNNKFLTGKWNYDDTTGIITLTEVCDGNYKIGGVTSNNHDMIIEKDNGSCGFDILILGNNPDNVSCHVSNNYTDAGAKYKTETLFSPDTVDLKNAGSYLLNYRKDEFIATRIVNVNNTNTPTLELTENEITVYGSDPFNASDYIKTATDPCEGDLKSSVTFTSDINKDVAGTYDVTYKLKNKGNIETTKVLKVTIIPLYRETVLNGATPELYDGLIPILHDGTKWVVADTKTQWYKYQDKKWANAVTVTSSSRDKYKVAGTEVLEADVLTYLVWIPRYKYKLWNVNGLSNPQSINIQFENNTIAKSTGVANGEWLTHPAFTFGTTELNGIWVGKFETGGTTANIKILPNIKSLTSIDVGTMFQTSRNMSILYSGNYGLNKDAIDTHMMKNMEWGAVTYLTNSIYGRYKTSSECIESGCEVWINNVNTGYDANWGPTITGCSGASQAAPRANNMTTCSTGYDWTKLGVNAATTGNITGIYDMSGGSYEYVMANMVNASGAFYPSGSSSFTAEAKYYDKYTYDASSTQTFNRGLLGDATKEMVSKTGSDKGSWYDDLSIMQAGNSPWLLRGGAYYSGTPTGIWGDYNTNGLSGFYRSTGTVSSNVGFRIVLTNK